MHLTNLSVTTFRNIEALTFEPSPTVNLLYGDNGSGKTNLLEAIFVLLVGRSQRGAQESTMIQQGASLYRISGTLKTQNGTYALASAVPKTGRKKITVDEIGIRLSELYDITCAVSIGPEDTEFIAGPPSARRLFLDLYLSQSSPTYLFNLSQYQRAVQQKNMALKQNGITEPFDELMVRHGSEIINARIQLIARLVPAAAELYARVSGVDSLMFSYVSSITSEEITANESTPEQIATLFMAAIQAQRHREQALQSAMVGPHRDDIEMTIDSYPARTHSSQGESRTAAIALKLAMFEYLKEIRKVNPILLLDEVFAELDAGRITRLVGTFERFGQLFVTSAGEPSIPLSADSRKFRIGYGRIQEAG